MERRLLSVEFWVSGVGLGAKSLRTIRALSLNPKARNSKTNTLVRAWVRRLQPKHLGSYIGVGSEGQV